VRRAVCGRVQSPRAGASAMQRTFDRSLDSLGEILKFVDAFAEHHGLGGKTAFATRLVTEELFANFVRHNRGGEERIEVSLCMDAGLLTLRLRDFNVEPFDIADREPVDVGRPLSERTAGGLGLHFVKSFFDGLSYEYADGTACVTATKSIGRTDV
jgi:serine/threonine-protein kinase RsbW